MLMFLPNLDEAFDQGYIRTADTGRIQLSKQLEAPLSFCVDSLMRITLANGTNTTSPVNANIFTGKDKWHQ
jgi:hypothetical protein